MYVALNVTSACKLKTTTLFTPFLVLISFSGTLPTTISALSNLEFLRISNNMFTGTLPGYWMRFLFNLHTLWISGNDFTGSVPKVLCTLFMDELRADCAPGDDGSIEIECDCCTFCCKPDGAGCLPTMSGA